MSLHYEFPQIVCLGDVLPYIEGKPEFIHVKKDGYSVINYTHMSSDTFPTVINVDDVEARMLRECRGLVFGSDGKVISRRYQKFFNFGERSDTIVDLSKSHVVLEKLDGSMISPILIDGGIRWISKMGITDTSMQAETFAADKPDYIDFAKHCIGLEWTPIFEWCSRSQRIVLDYPVDKLVLTAVRRNHSGGYMSHGMMEYWTPESIPVVKSHDLSCASIEEVALTIRAIEGSEGVVIRFDDGHMVKVKSEWYVTQHRAKADISSERHAVKIILEGLLDDYLPILPPNDADNLKRFSSEVIADVLVFGMNVCNAKQKNERDDTSRKDYALNSVDDQFVKTAVFALWDEPMDDFHEKVYSFTKNYLLKCTGGNSMFNSRAKSILLTASMKEIVL
jgi:RNA ligase